MSSPYPPPVGPPGGLPGPPVAPVPAPPSQWPPASPASTPPPNDSGSRSRILLVVGGALVVLVVLVATVAVLIDDGGPQAAVAPTVEPSPPATPEAVAAILPELQAFVEEERGLAFTEPVDVEVLETDAYRQRTGEQFETELEESREDLEAAAAQYQALGLLDPDVDIVETLESFYSTATAGFYDSETKELVVQGTDLNEDLRVTLVHELTHALDDQVFGLERPELEERTDEADFGFSALVEGNASRVDAAYVESLSPDEQVEYFRQAAEAAGGVDFDAFPPVLLLEEQFVYGNGLEFVQALVDEDGNDAVDDAFDSPPLTSEAVLEPETYLQGEGAESVPPPDADGEVLDEGVGGQFLLELLVSGGLEGGGVPEWVGDRYVVWEEGGGTCVRIAYVGDLDELEDALAPWENRTGGRIERVDDTVTVTGCTV